MNESCGGTIRQELQMNGSCGGTIRQELQMNESCGGTIRQRTIRQRRLWQLRWVNLRAMSDRQLFSWRFERCEQLGKDCLVVRNSLLQDFERHSSVV